MPPGAHPLVAAVRTFVETEVVPAASDLSTADRYPHALVARMRGLGLFGALVPAAYGGLGLDVTTYARIVEELCRGWMSLAGVINSHTMAALIVLHHGTEEQRRRFLPRLASGEARGGLCLTEPHAGSDVQAIRTTARRRGDAYVIDGTKMFVTNGREGNTFALLAVTDPAAAPRHRGMSCFIVEKGAPGLAVVKSIAKLGYKGVDTAELLFEGFVVPAANLVGGVEGRGFGQVMSGLETGRINIAARAVGVAQTALDRARASAGRLAAPPPILADMAARLEGARLLTYWAAGMKDRAERCDLEAGMAKLEASETAQRLAEHALRLGGPPAAVAASVEERLYRDTPLMIIGEGTNEIQRTLIARQLVERHGERLAAVPRDAEPEERRRTVLAVRQFVEKVVVPVAAELEREARHPAALVGDLAQLGVLGALVPPALGGAGLDLPAWAMVIEELARGWSVPAAIVAGHAAATWAVARSGRPELARRWLPVLATGERLGAAALDAALPARRDGDRLVVTGSTPPVDAAPRAGLFLVSVLADGARPALAVVPREAPGLAVGAVEPTLGARGLEPAPLRLTDVRIDAASVLEGDAGAGALARLGLAATGVGLAQAAFEAALRYSQQRSAFGRPICQHQAVQLTLADMATAVTAARLLTSRAAERLADGDDLPAALARLRAADVAARVTLEAMRVHGGYGYTAEFTVERFYRDAPRLALALGGVDADRAAVARRLAGPAG